MPRYNGANYALRREFSLPYRSAKMIPKRKSYPGMGVYSNYRACRSLLKSRDEFWVVVMTGFYGAVEAGSGLPVLSTLDTGGGSHREPLHPSSLLPFHRVESTGIRMFVS